MGKNIKVMYSTEEISKLEAELTELSAVFNEVLNENRPLSNRIAQLESEIKEMKADIEQETYSKVMGDIKPGCWAEVTTGPDNTFIAYFQGYDERDGYETPVFIVPRETEGFEYEDIEQIKKVSQKVATDYIKRGCCNE